MCSTCDEPAIRELGTKRYCSAHLGALLATFDARLFLHNGFGLQTGLLRPEYGPGVADLTCIACSAGWVGIPGDACWWCLHDRAVFYEHQARLVLQPPDIEPTDQRFVGAMRAWAERLARAALAGIISETAATSAWRRAVARG